MYSFPIRSGEHDVQVDQHISPDPLSTHRRSVHHLSPPSAAELHVQRPDATAGAMQLMTFNSLLMFDIVFVFFLFLVGVTCLVYYMPPASRSSSTSSSSSSTSSSAPSTAAKSCRHHSHHYAPLHYHHHPREHCPGASRMAHREHGFAAAAVVSTVERYSSSAESSDVESGSTSGSSSHRRSGSTIEFFTATPETAAKFADEGLLIDQLVEGTATVATTSSRGGATRTVPQCCYVKAKNSSARRCSGPVHEV